MVTVRAEMHAELTSTRTEVRRRYSLSGCPPVEVTSTLQMDPLEVVVTHVNGVFDSLLLHGHAIRRNSVDERTTTTFLAADRVPEWARPLIEINEEHDEKESA